MPNHLSLCSDGIFARLYIKGQTIIDEDKNIKNIKELKTKSLIVRKNAEIHNDLIVDGQT